MTEVVIFGILFAIAAMIFLNKWVMNRATDKFYQLMLDTNRLHNTSFPVRRKDAHLVLGFNSGVGVIAFDPENRKICYVSKHGKSAEVFDFSYIKSWELNWHDKGAQSVGVHFLLSTPDLKRPQLKIPVNSLSDGKNWENRLDILFAQT